MSIAPVKIEQVDERTVTVEWSDGHASRYEASTLRNACPCAACLEIGRRAQTLPLLPDVPPEAVTIDEISPVGRYAIRFRFSDGHATGIYTYEHLRSLCPCVLCRR